MEIALNGFSRRKSLVHKQLACTGKNESAKDDL